MHLYAYRNLELGHRPVVARTRRLCILVERENVRARFQIAGSGPGRQVFSTADRALERMQGLEGDGTLRSADGRRRVRYLSLCSGIEAATAAMERINADAVPVGFSEINPAGNAVLRHRWPDVPRLGDLMDVDWSLLRGQVDLVVAGPPCQPFSISGKRLGLADPRGNMLLHCLRAVGSVQPRWFLFENVPGLLSANGGNDFEVFLDAVEELGYAVAWRVLDAKFFGLPQRRRRLWIVGEHCGSGRGPEAVLDLAPRAARDPGARRTSWQTAARRACHGSDVEDERDVDWSEADVWLKGRAVTATKTASPAASVSGEILTFKVSASAGARGIGAKVGLTPTLVSASGGNQVPGLIYAADLRHGTVGDLAATLQVGPEGGWSLNAGPTALVEDDGKVVLRRFTPLECLRLQGFDDDWLDGPKLLGKPLSDSDRYSLVGNSWPVPVAAWILERLLPRLEETLPANPLG